MKKISVFLTILFVCAFWFSCAQAGEIREWTFGSRSIEGEFIELTENGTIVRIRKTNGKVSRVPLAKLSPKDQEYIKKTETALPSSPGKSSRKPKSDKASSDLAAGTSMVFNVDGIKYVFRWCPPGTFQMGSPKTEKEHCKDETLHKVTLTHGFWMLETEVTQAMWQSVMVDSIHQQAKFGSSSHNLYGEGPNYPMYYVSWDDCQVFCGKLSEKIGLFVTLPTEAQWEYACRAGTTTAFYFGERMFEDEGNFWNYDNKNPEATPVKSYPPNPWGLYDMHGNVWEWCQDMYAPYSSRAVTDPKVLILGPTLGRIYRGGGWDCLMVAWRSASRGYDSPDTPDLGFRPVSVSDPK